MRPPREVGRILVVALLLFLMATTAWVCLTLGLVLLLAQLMGTGLALLAVGAALVLLATLVGFAARAARPDRRPTPGLAQRVLPKVLAQGAIEALGRPVMLRAILLLVGLMFGLAAALVPGARSRDGDPST